MTKGTFPQLQLFKAVLWFPNELWNYFYLSGLYRQNPTCLC